MIFVAKIRHVQWMSGKNWYSKILASVCSVQWFQWCCVIDGGYCMNTTFCIADVHSMSRKPCLHSSQRVSMFTGSLAKLYWHSSASVFTVYCFLWCDSPVRRRGSAMKSCEVFVLQGHMLTTLFMEYKRSLEVDAALDGARFIACDRTENHFSTDAGQTVYERTGVCETCRDILQNPLSTDKQKRTQCVPDRCWLSISSTMDFVQCREASLEVLFSRRVSRSWKHCTGSPEVAGVTSVIIAYVVQQNCFCRPLGADRLS